MPSLSIQELTRPGLSPASLTADTGQCVVITGPSGGGKSLLLRAIADLDPNRGEVVLDGVKRSSTPAPAWRRLVRYVAAESGWWRPLVKEHFAAPRAVASRLAKLGLAGDCMSWPVSRLSTGEKQRLALARALDDDTRVLLLDEPTAALDAETTAAVESLIRARMGAGTVVLLVTHDAGQVTRLATRVLQMRAGTLGPFLG